MRVKTSQQGNQVSATGVKVRPQPSLMTQTPALDGRATSLLNFQHIYGNRLTQQMLRPALLQRQMAVSRPGDECGASEMGEERIQRDENPASDDAFPVINLEFAVDPGQTQRCCTCGTPPCVGHLGPPAAGDNTAQNGMNLVATILHTIASSTRSLDYGFVQIVRARRCLEFLPAVGGGWTVTNEWPVGTNDVFGACATCTTPQVRDGLPEIVFADAPGFVTANSRLGAPAFGNQLMQRANLQTWVIAREGRGPWRRISVTFNWHSVSWIRRDPAGNWELNPGHNRIGPGWASFGAGCPA